MYLYTYIRTYTEYSQNTIITDDHWPYTDQFHYLTRNLATTSAGLAMARSFLYLGM